MRDATADAGAVTERGFSPDHWERRSYTEEIGELEARAWTRMRLSTAGGSSAVPDEELLALLVWPDEAKGERIASVLVDRFGSMPAVFGASCEALASVPGVSRADVLRIKALQETVRRVAKAALACKPRCPRRFKDYLVATRRCRTTHDFSVIYLDDDKRIVADEVLGAPGLAKGRKLATHMLTEVARRALQLGVSCVAPVESVPATGAKPTLAALRRSRVLRTMLQPLDIVMLPYRVLTLDHLLTLGPGWWKREAVPAPEPVVEPG